MSEIQVIVDLLTENNKKLEGLNQSFITLHSDLTNFKGEMTTALTDTNGRLKGSNELLNLKIGQMNDNLKNIEKTLSDQIQINHGEILRNKNTISSLYELDRTATKRNDDANALVKTEMMEEFSAFSIKSQESREKIQQEVKIVSDNATSSNVKINILFGITGAMALAIFVELISRI